MRTANDRKRGCGRAFIAVLTVGMLGLAASPAALARDRGGPGQPGVTPAYGDQQLPREGVLQPFVSWTD